VRDAGAVMKRDHQFRWYRTLLSLVLAMFTTAWSSVPQLQEPGTALTVLTLNLHTYQEFRDAGSIESELTDELAVQRIAAYGAIFDRIAAGIERLDPDIICLQEVGEWAGGKHADSAAVEFGASDSNMVHQILSRLGDRHYYHTMDWSHYGWDVWLEGSAILSKYPLGLTESRFISTPANNARDSWKSRNVPMAMIDVPELGSIAVFSVHAGWWDDSEEPFQAQYQRLLRWAAEVTKPASATILCGDFNVAAASPGYAFMTQGTGYADQYALANPDGMLDATIGSGADGWETGGVGRRIDYILMNEDSPLEASRARHVFTDKYLGRVSDHVGVYAEFVISPDR
jgi:maltose 6'-phosphate phosphatase